MNSIKTKNQELFKRFAVLKKTCVKVVDYTLRVQDMDYEGGTIMTIWNIITEYIHDDEVLYLKEVSDK